MSKPANGGTIRATLLSRLRARLQPCHNTIQRLGASGPEGVPADEIQGIPQRLKPPSEQSSFGTAEAVPLSNTNLLRQIFPIRRLRFAQAILVFSLAIVMLGAGDTTEKRYERVGHNMMCACGCGQILLECNHVGCPDSARMIGELHDQMATGGSDKTILDWFVQKYGATVLAAPLRGGFDNVAWITPIALFLFAILGTAAIIRVWKARTQQRVPLKIKGMTSTSTDELRERIRRETEY